MGAGAWVHQGKDGGGVSNESGICPKCGNDDMEWESCWHCLGAGGFHECGEDCCVCVDKEEITETCSECNGDGGYLICNDCIAAAQEKHRSFHE